MGLIICLEGMIGSGKTTQAELLHAAISHSYLLPELNQHSPLKETIQSWKKRRPTFTYTKEDILELADAYAQTQKKLLLLVPPNAMIITDRNVYTPIVYQADAMPMDEIAQIHKKAGVLFPEFGMVLDCAPATALARVDERRKQAGVYATRSWQENLMEFERRKARYVTLVNATPSLKVICSESCKENVFEKVKNTLRRQYHDIF